MPKAHILILIVVIVPVLVSCAPPLTYADTRATAIVAGCGPGNMATPPAVTVTPDPRFVTPSPTATLGPGTPTATLDPGTPTATSQPTATRLPTTTPYPRCTPGPDETLVPWPTPVPPKPPYPTQKPKLRQGGSDEQNVIQIPGHTYRLKIRVHPTEGWPAVGIMQRFSESADPIQSFVRVFNPITRKWSPAQQVDIGDSSNGQDRFGSTVVGITGDRVVHAVFGASDQKRADDDTITIYPYLWVSDSADYGATWSPPRQIARDCWVADDMATTAGGWIVVTANCFTRSGSGLDGAPTMIVRRPDGSWLAPVRVFTPAWYGAEGAVVIVGDGDDARAIALRLGKLGSRNGKVYLISKRLADPGDWEVQERQITVPYGDTGERHYHASGLVFPQTHPDGSVTSGVIFTWTGAYATGAYALISLDAGQSWGLTEPIVFDGRDPREAGGYHIQWVAPVYDPAANRLIAIWTCCADANFEQAESTHYASWSIPGSGIWLPAQLPGRSDPRIPVVLGSRSAWNSVAAQSSNARVTWIAWVEAGNQIHVRTLNLNQVVPIEEYPTPTPRPLPTPTTGGTP